MRGSITGDLPAERENTDFVVVDSERSGPAGNGNGGGNGGLARTGVEVQAPLMAGGAAILLFLGAGLWALRRREVVKVDDGE
ncbi:LPXTG cell wall anchor domain-containing protein [Microbacterium sp. CFBP 13617]|uniref:LPXTG cell wall anchor domain-containing protein n=1 Tax=Microbacterium sp. CFBP 13617 TaxID=2774035 RepID=UPI00177E145E|nr:LPXTG cell wall anchor domain-containing protein [Microbacterium sp. CFBP 13617]MBD8219333.1 LPXTG cell wall anchor domain-containing protein [Microbacterium sp. CFBP 13617]